jgi:hypothetical protein
MEVKVTSLFKTCNSCPSQWEGGTQDNRQIYIRYRYGRLTVSVGDVGDDDEFAAVRGEVIFSDDIGDDLDGYLSDDEMRERLRGVVEFQ